MKKCKDQAWFRKLASELARRNAGKIDVSVAQTSEILGHLCDIISERCSPQLDEMNPKPGCQGDPIGAAMCRQGLKRRLAAAKRKK